MDNFQLPNIKNVDELKALFQQYQQFLSPENAALISSLITEMEKGQDNVNTDRLKDLASSLEKNAHKEENNL